MKLLIVGIFLGILGILLAPFLLPLTLASKLAGGGVLLTLLSGSLVLLSDSRPIGQPLSSWTLLKIGSAMVTSGALIGAVALHFFGDSTTRYGLLSAGTAILGGVFVLLCGLTRSR